MATVFNMYFDYVELSEGSYDDNGLYVHGGELIRKKVRGTLQSASYKERIAALTGSRNTGNIDVISSEALKPSTRGGNDGGYVKFGTQIYQLVSEQYYPHLRNIAHWKYVAEMVPADEVPESVKEALDG
jgi:hypothetical protein